ncbi:MAG TPA: hypothetical protein VLJ17_21615, partial [Xanthobacteraceae bacterium]|nr:hypothetical protein [Xanthobacteraceae bacterium]
MSARPQTAAAFLEGGQLAFRATNCCRDRIGMMATSIPIGRYCPALAPHRQCHCEMPITQRRVESIVMSGANSHRGV